MHEASLVQGLLDIVLNALENYQAANPARAETRISEITCEAGLLAGFEAETLRACFEIFAEGTPAQNANLLINTAPLACSCANCGAEFTISQRKFVCPQCGSEEISFSGGHGLTLQAVKIEEMKDG